MSLLKLLLEKTGDTYEYGCVMLYLKFPSEKLHKHIKEEDVYEEEADRSYGLEDEPHVTLLYGLHEGVTLEQVKKILDSYSFTTVNVHNASLFKKDEYDVLKFDVDAPVLNAANKALTKLPHTNDYPDYHAHMTIGYIKPGKGDSYVKKFKKLEFKITPSYAVYSEAGGTKTKIPIKIKKEKDAK